VRESQGFCDPRMREFILTMETEREVRVTPVQAFVFLRSEK
jgi:hypothetical protein